MEDGEIMMIDSDSAGRGEGNEVMSDTASSSDDDEGSIDYTWIKKGMTVVVKYELEGGTLTEGVVFVRKVDHHTGEMLVLWFYYPKDIPNLRETLSRYNGFHLAAGRVEELFFSTTEQKLYMESVICECEVWCLENSVRPDYASLVGPKGGYLGGIPHVCWLVLEFSGQNKNDKLHSLTDGGFVHEEAVITLLTKTRNRLIERGFDLVPLTERDFKTWHREPRHEVRYVRRLKADELSTPLKPTRKPSAPTTIRPESRLTKLKRPGFVEGKGKAPVDPPVKKARTAAQEGTKPPLIGGANPVTVITWASIVKERIKQLEAQLRDSVQEEVGSERENNELSTRPSSMLLDEISYVEQRVLVAGKELERVRPEAFRILHTP